MCHMSGAAYLVSGVTFQTFIHFEEEKNGLSGGASCWRVYYQWGRPRLVFTLSDHICMFQGAGRAPNLSSFPGKGFRKPSNLKQKRDGTACKKASSYCKKLWTTPYFIIFCVAP